MYISLWIVIKTMDINWGSTNLNGSVPNLHRYLISGLTANIRSNNQFCSLPKSPCPFLHIFFANFSHLYLISTLWVKNFIECTNSLFCMLFFNYSTVMVYGWKKHSELQFILHRYWDFELVVLWPFALGRYMKQSFPCHAVSVMS